MRSSDAALVTHSYLQYVISCMWWQLIIITDQCAVERWLNRDTIRCVTSAQSRHDSFVTHSRVWHLLVRDMPGSWHIQMCNIYSFVTCPFRDTFTCVTPTRSWNVWLVTHSDVWHLLVRDMTHSWHMCDIYMPGLWHIQMYDICSFVTCLIRDTFIDVMSNMTYIQ